MAMDQCGQCAVCMNEPNSWGSLVRCAMCSKSVCLDCAVKGFGQRFCSYQCMNYYMYSEEDEESGAYEDE
jgi:hypothetical protein